MVTRSITLEGAITETSRSLLPQFSTTKEGLPKKCLDRPQISRDLRVLVLPRYSTLKPIQPLREL